MWPYMLQRQPHPKPDHNTPGASRHSNTSSSPQQRPRKRRMQGMYADRLEATVLRKVGVQHTALAFALPAHNVLAAAAQVLPCTQALWKFVNSGHQPDKKRVEAMLAELQVGGACCYDPMHSSWACMGPQTAATCVACRRYWGTTMRLGKRCCIVSTTGE